MLAPIHTPVKGSQDWFRVPGIGFQMSVKPDPSARVVSRGLTSGRGHGSKKEGFRPVTVPFSRQHLATGKDESHAVR